MVETDQAVELEQVRDRLQDARATLQLIMPMVMLKAVIL